MEYYDWSESFNLSLHSHVHTYASSESKDYHIMNLCKANLPSEKIIESMYSDSESFSEFYCMWRVVFVHPETSKYICHNSRDCTKLQSQGSLWQPCWLVGTSLFPFAFVWSLAPAVMLLQVLTLLGASHRPEPAFLIFLHELQGQHGVSLTEDIACAPSYNWGSKCWMDALRFIELIPWWLTRPQFYLFSKPVTLVRSTSTIFPCCLS